MQLEMICEQQADANEIKISLGSALKPQILIN